MHERKPIVATFCVEKSQIHCENPSDSTHDAIEPFWTCLPCFKEQKSMNSCCLESNKDNFELENQSILLESMEMN